VRSQAVLRLVWQLAVLIALVGLTLADGPTWLIGSLLTLLGVQLQPVDPKPPR
jgi:hypothetical protein